MFQGSIPADVRNMIFEAVQGWSSPKFAVACSGNFTIERILDQAKIQHIQGCDVSIYTCALGAYFAGQPFRLELKPEYAESLAWLAPSLETQVGKVSTLMLFTGFANALRPSPNAYYTRLLGGYRQQWSTLMEKTVKRLESVPLKLADFHAGDAVPWVESLPEETAVLSFPPFFAKGYVNMWAMHDKIFSWDAPAFGEIFEEHRRRFMTALTNRPEWIVGSSERLPELEPYLRGVSRTSGGVLIHNYSPVSKTRVVNRTTKKRPLNIKRLSPGQRLTPDSSIGLKYLDIEEFSSLRSQYLKITMDVQISNVWRTYAVLVDGCIAGVFAIRTAHLQHGATPDSIYLVSDFCVSSSDYARLSKLILYAALSKESHLIVERMAKRRCRVMVTTAFSDHPVSMKYRGLFDLTSRKETHLDNHAYQLNYSAPIGQWTLKEGYQVWFKKYGHILKESANDGHD